MGVTSTASSDKKPDVPVSNKPKEEAVKPPIITPSGELGEIIVKLNWSQGTRPDGSKTAIDLDLGCLYELKDGQKGCIQALDEFFGDFLKTPYIHLSEDDRKGDKGEILRINGDKVAEFKRILVYAYIYKGIAKWSDATGVVVKIKLPEVIDQVDIEVKLDNPSDGIKVCAIALFKNVDDQTFKVSKNEKYFRDHLEMDKDFKWGLDWVNRSKEGEKWRF